MDKPTEWTYGGLLDWSSADTLKLAPWRPAFECIIQAIRERWLACFLRTKARTWDWTTDEWGIVKECPPLSLPFTFAQSIELDIDDLIQWSLNNTQTQYIDGLATPVFWTKAELLEYLEIESFIHVTKLAPVSAAWVYQCYRLLNALQVFAPVYYMSYYPVGSSTQYIIKESVQCAPYKSRYRGARVSGDVSWADLLAKYAAEAEDEETIYPSTLIKRSAATLFDDESRGFVAERYKTRYSAYVSGIGNVTVRLTTNYKLYISFLKGPSSSFVFDNHGDSNVENSIIKYQMEETLNENTDFVFTNYIPITDSFTQPTTPEIGGQYDEHTYGLTGYTGSGERRTFVITCEPDFAFKSDE